MPPYVDLFRRLDKLDRREGIVELSPGTLAIKAAFADFDCPDGRSSADQLQELAAAGNELAKHLLSDPDGSALVEEI
jgi:hypothetical protein